MDWNSDRSSKMAQAVFLQHLDDFGRIARQSRQFAWNHLYIPGSLMEF